jgi:hypothetical protein
VYEDGVHHRRRRIVVRVEERREIGYEMRKSTTRRFVERSEIEKGCKTTYGKVNDIKHIEVAQIKAPIRILQPEYALRARLQLQLLVDEAADETLEHAHVRARELLRALGREGLAAGAGAGGDAEVVEDEAGEGTGDVNQFGVIGGTEGGIVELVGVGRW